MRLVNSVIALRIVVFSMFLSVFMVCVVCCCFGVLSLFFRYLLKGEKEIDQPLSDKGYLLLTRIVSWQYFRRTVGSSLVPLFFSGERRPFLLLSKESFDESDFFGVFGVVFAVLVGAGGSSVSVVVVGYDGAFDVVPFVFEDLLFLWGAEAP